MSLFDTGVRPAIDAYLKAKSEEVRDYGDYWSASSAGYCMRLNIMRRLKIPKVPELADNAALTRVFESGHIFHSWIQGITKGAGLSIAQELELQDEDLMIRGHIDDLVLVGPTKDEITYAVRQTGKVNLPEPHLILYDYKTQNSMAFSWQKGRPMSYFHRYQLGTYMYMLRKHQDGLFTKENVPKGVNGELTEARILKISKDDLRMSEQQLMWSEQLQNEVTDYWNTLNAYWLSYKEKSLLPDCTCLDHEGGFMGKRSSKGKVYNDFYFEDEPCSKAWHDKWLKTKVKE